MANDDTKIRRIPHSKVAKVWALFGSRGPKKCVNQYFHKIFFDTSDASDDDSLQRYPILPVQNRLQSIEYRYRIHWNDLLKLFVI